jgi:hypothetical protein
LNGQNSARLQPEDVHQPLRQPPGLLFARGIHANFAGPGRRRERGGRIPGDREGNEKPSPLARECSLEQLAERAKAPSNARPRGLFSRPITQTVAEDVLAHAPSRVLLRVSSVMPTSRIHTRPSCAVYGRSGPLPPSPLYRCRPTRTTPWSSPPPTEATTALPFFTGRAESHLPGDYSQPTKAAKDCSLLRS